MSGETYEVPLNTVRPALFLVLFGTSSLFAAQKQIDPDRSSLRIHVGKTGLLSAAGHEHIVMAPITEGSIDDGQPSYVSFRVEAARLAVMPEEHQTEVQHSMQERILESSRFPEISFTSETIQPIGENAWNVSGNLQLHGQTRVIHLSVHKEDGRYIGATTITQTDIAFNRSVPSAAQ
jgi:polyisoprenoid-binding protein YceI